MDVKKSSKGLGPSWYKAKKRHGQRNPSKQSKTRTSIDMRQQPSKEVEKSRPEGEKTKGSKDNRKERKKEKKPRKKITTRNIKRDERTTAENKSIENRCMRNPGYLYARVYPAGVFEKEKRQNKDKKRGKKI